MWTMQNNFTCGKSQFGRPVDADLESYNMYLPCGSEWVAKAHWRIYRNGLITHRGEDWVGDVLTPRIINC
jgi:hypothetical protein